MTAESFCYWLMGYMEISATGAGDWDLPALNAVQLAVVRQHLDLVFLHDIDPRAGGPDIQKTLNGIHGLPSADPKKATMRC